MSFNFLKTTFLLITCNALLAGAQEQNANVQNAFQALTQTKQLEYKRHKKNAFEAMEREKFFTCLMEISDARAILKQDKELLFLSGICRAQLHDVDKAVEYYEKVLAIDPTHSYTLFNIIEINYFAGNYVETIKYINKINSIIGSRANGKKLPLLDFKHLVSLTKLAKTDSDQYGAELERVRAKYTYMDDNPFYYYANALKSLDAGDKQEGLVWILKAYLIFNRADIIEVWNKALVDTGFIDAHEIMFNRQEKK